MWGRLLALRELGHQVHLVATVKAYPADKEVAHVKKMVNQLDFVEREPNWTGIFSSLPVQVVSRSRLKEIRFKGDFDVALGESEFVYPAFQNRTLQAGLRVLRIHNDEGRFMRELAAVEHSSFKLGYYRIETRRLSRFSPTAMASVDQLWFSSSDQFMDYMDAHPDSTGRAAWLPPPITMDALVFPRIKGSRQVLFVGGLSAIPNIEAIEWYMSGVHSRLKEIEGYRFAIAGNTRGRPISRVLREAAGDEHCALHTDVADLSALYSESAVFVNPMLHGASIKMKTVNAAENGLPVVTTRIGNEGTGFLDQQHVRIADKPDLFALQIKSLLCAPAIGVQMAERAQEFLRARYRHAEQIASLLGQEPQGLHSR